MHVILRVLALACFALAVAWCIIDDTPDVFDILAAGFGGAGLWCLSTIVPDR